MITHGKAKKQSLTALFRAERCGECGNPGQAVTSPFAGSRNLCNHFENTRAFRASSGGSDLNDVPMFVGFKPAINFWR
jgi:hypothetical protein